MRSEFPGMGLPYRKFVFEGVRREVKGLLEEFDEEEGPSRGGRGRQAGGGQKLKWGVVRERDLELVISRSVLPRTKALGRLPSAAVFVRTRQQEEGDGGEEQREEDWQPVAWAFLGLDGSLTSLHVEPGWRRRGLAKALAAKLFRDEGMEAVGGGVVRDLREGLMHSDVAVDNKESTGVCVSLGGRAAWDCYWIRVDLDRVREVSSTGGTAR